MSIMDGKKGGGSNLGKRGGGKKGLDTLIKKTTTNKVGDATTGFGKKRGRVGGRGGEARGCF